MLNVPVRITEVGSNLLKPQLQLAHSPPHLAIWTKLHLFNNVRPKAGRPVPLTPTGAGSGPKCEQLPLLHDKRTLAQWSSFSQSIPLAFQLCFLIPSMWDTNPEWQQEVEDQTCPSSAFHSCVQCLLWWFFHQSRKTIPYSYFSASLPSASLKKIQEYSNIKAAVWATETGNQFARQGR